MQLHSRDEARVWLHTRMTTRWKPVGSRYPKAMRKLERFCAPGEAAAARSALAAVHTPAEVAPAVRDAAAALRALRRLGGDALETANVVEQAALDVLQDANPNAAIPPLHGALLKNEQDVMMFERLAFMARRQS